MTNGKRYRVSTPTERDGKTYWTNLGMAFEGKGGSITMNLAAVPTTGKLVLFIDDGERKGGGGSGGGGGGRSEAPPADDDSGIPF